MYCRAFQITKLLRIRHILNLQPLHITLRAFVKTIFVKDCGAHFGLGGLKSNREREKFL